MLLLVLLKIKIKINAKLDIRKIWVYVLCVSGDWSKYFKLMFVTINEIEMKIKKIFEQILKERGLYESSTKLK